MSVVFSIVCPSVSSHQQNIKLSYYNPHLHEICRKGKWDWAVLKGEKGSYCFHSDCTTVVEIPFVSFIFLLGLSLHIFDFFIRERLKEDAWDFRIFRLKVEHPLGVWGWLEPWYLLHRQQRPELLPLGVSSTSLATPGPFKEQGQWWRVAFSALLCVFQGSQSRNGLCS